MAFKALSVDNFGYHSRSYPMCEKLNNCSGSKPDYTCHPHPRFYLIVFLSFFISHIKNTSLESSPSQPTTVFLGWRQSCHLLRTSGIWWRRSCNSSWLPLTRSSPEWFSSVRLPSCITLRNKGVLKLPTCPDRSTTRSFNVYPLFLVSGHEWLLWNWNQSQLLSKQLSTWISSSWHWNVMALGFVLVFYHRQI